MSTKIYNGYYSNLNLNQLLLKFKDLVPIFEQLKKEAYTETLMEIAIKKIDEKYINGEEVKEIDIIGKLYDEHDDLIRESKSLRLPFDYSASCCLFPCGRKTLILFYSDNKKVLKNWEELDFIFDYHYQDQVDMPEDIPIKLWNLRKKDWDKVLGGDGWGIPSQNGYQFTFSLLNLPFFSLIRKNLINYIPSSEKRSLYLLHLKFYREKKKNNPNLSDYLIMKEFREWNKTDDCKKEIDIISKSLKNIVIL